MASFDSSTPFTPASRYYRHQDSPLAPALGRYAGFFALFEDFQGYVDFFLLQDLLSSDYEAVRFFQNRTAC